MNWFTGIIGFLVALVIVALVNNENEKLAVRSGIVKLDNSYYSITKLELGSRP